MLFHAFLTFYRSLARRRLYVALNVFGLAFGIAAFFALTLVVRSEDGFDRWGPDAAKVYRVDSVRSRLEQTRQQNVSAMFAALDPLPTEYIQIEAGTQAMDRGRAGRRIQMLVSCPVVFLHHIT
ncbi:MAG: hypothetical protein ACRYGI_09270 [Janthinobacterium lividum]